MTLLVHMLFVRSLAESWAGCSISSLSGDRHLARIELHDDLRRLFRRHRERGTPGGTLEIAEGSHYADVTSLGFHFSGERLALAGDEGKLVAPDELGAERLFVLFEEREEVSGIERGKRLQLEHLD